VKGGVEVQGRGKGREWRGEIDEIQGSTKVYL
jgi:hypothetical protein